MWTGLFSLKRCWVFQAVIYSFGRATRLLFFPGKDSASEKARAVITTEFPTSFFFFYKMVLLPLTCRNLHMACHDYRPQIIILCWPQTSPYLLEKDLTVGFKSKPFSMLEKSVLIQESFTLKSKLDSFQYPILVCKMCYSLTCVRLFVTPRL